MSQKLDEVNQIIKNNYSPRGKRLFKKKYKKIYKKLKRLLLIGKNLINFMKN